jgi:peptidylprolyl isomerase
MRAAPLILLCLGLCLEGSVAALAAPPSPAPAPALSMSDLLAGSPASDWRTVDPENTVYMDLPSGRVVMELAPDFAPNHAANIRALIREGYFDKSAIVRSQDNYVVQWSAPEDRPVGKASASLKAEFDKPIGSEPFTPLPDPDTYAPVVGFSGDFPAARDPKTRRTWLVHCYGMVGAGRDEGADTGGGKELYAVIGQSPRNLDRNVTLVGRVIDGIERLSVLPRGTGDLGFYKTDAEKTPIIRVRMASDLPAAERTSFQTLRTDSATFQTLVQSRRYRKDSWYLYSAGKLGVCNTPLPVRIAKP